MRRLRSFVMLTMWTVGLASASWALEDCNLKPKGGQEIEAALQCLDRNIRALAQSPAATQGGQLSTTGVFTKYKAGVYRSADGKQTYRVAGPAQTGEPGREKWSLSADDGKFSATWITGPVEGHPALKDAKAPKGLSSAYEYGRVGSSSRNGPYDGWVPGRLIGVSQVGEDLAVSYFGANPSTDASVESKSLSLRLVKEPSAAER